MDEDLIHFNRKGGFASIDLDVSSLDRLSKELTKYPVHAKNILEDSLRAGARVARKQIPQLTSQVYTISEKMVKDAQQVKVVRRYQHSVVLFGHPLVLSRFWHTPRSPRGKSPVQVAVMRGKLPFQLSTIIGADGEEKVPYLFHPRTSSKDAAVPYLIARWTGETSSRTGKEILQVFRTVSVPQMVQNPLVQEKLTATVSEAVDKKMNRELDDLLSRMKGTVEE